jgi:hypothetical protein
MAVIHEASWTSRRVEAAGQLKGLVTGGYLLRNDQGPQFK